MIPKKAARKDKTNPKLDRSTKKEVTEGTAWRGDPLLSSDYGVVRPLRDPARNFDPMNEQSLVTIGGRR